MKKRGQVWIETVLYTLIGLALIGLTLAFVMPKINQSRDGAIVDQSIESLLKIQEKMDEIIEKGSGNVRNINLVMKKGELIFNGQEEKIYIVLDDFDKPYSEPGSEISIGRVKLITEESVDGFTEKLYIDYSGIADIKFEGQDIERKYGAIATGRYFSMENLGDSDGDGIAEINIEENS